MFFRGREEGWLRKALSEHLGRMTSHLSGHRLDDFVKLNKLGEGTYGVVFKVSKHCIVFVYWPSNILRLKFRDKTRKPVKLWQ